MSRIAVIGCGPAGLLAAEAACTRVKRVDIIASEIKPSRISGAQYLHESIPNVTGYEPDFHVQVLKVGDRDGYAMKVYGDIQAEVSWDHYSERKYPAWDMEAAYKTMWDKFDAMGAFVRATVGFHNIREILGDYDLVINTAPMCDLCQRGHNFKSQNVWIRRQPALQGREAGGAVMVYNGSGASMWYRMSVIAGQISWEYARPGKDDEGQPLEIMITKPLSTDCDCWPAMLRAGRYGMWDKHQLSHHAYNITLEKLNEVLRVQ